MNVFEQIKQKCLKRKIGRSSFMEFLEVLDEVEKEQNNEWIPVEERLPEDGVRVLTCDNYKNVHVMRHYNFYEYPFCIGPEHERYYMPKAWMPLPEPYKECEEE